MSINRDSEDNEKSDVLDYRSAGVNIDAGDSLVSDIAEITKSTSRPEVLSNLGGFGALCEIPKNYTHPVLVSATDGVGTKLKLAMALKKHDTIGIDLVAMCVNDLIVCGAEPLFFLDYYATGKLDLVVAKSVIAGIGEGCKMAGCALVGGETAEMPGMYSNDDYDLAGFAVGVVEKNSIIDQSKVSISDILIGIHSSGPHSNGYSLIRKILELNKTDLSTPFDDETLGEKLLCPTRIYVQMLNRLKNKLQINAIAHITGGGLIENMPRVIPDKMKANIELKSWQQPAIFSWLQDQGSIASHEMYRTFNCGIGMVISVNPNDVEQAIDLLNREHFSASIIGYFSKKTPDEKSIQLI